MTSSKIWIRLSPKSSQAEIKIATAVIVINDTAVWNVISPAIKGASAFMRCAIMNPEDDVGIAA